MRISRLALTLVTLVAPIALFSTTVVQAKDFRTAFVRVVPEQDWKPEKGSAIALEVANGSTQEKSGEFSDAFAKELTEQLGRVLGYSIDPKSATKVKFTIAEFEPGNAGLRLGLGFGGKAYVGGTIEVHTGGKEVGSLLYSFRPNSPGAAGMAREAAAGLALKLTNGERDKELHTKK
jgi:hypothetical protein